MMPEDSDQLTDDELWASFGSSLDVLQEFPVALESAQTVLSEVIQEMSVAVVPEVEPWLHRLCRICNEQPLQPVSCGKTTRRLIPEDLQFGRRLVGSSHRSIAAARIAGECRLRKFHEQ